MVGISDSEMSENSGDSDSEMSENGGDSASNCTQSEIDLACLAGYCMSLDVCRITDSIKCLPQVFGINIMYVRGGSDTSLTVICAVFTSLSGTSIIL